MIDRRYVNYYEDWKDEGFISKEMYDKMMIKLSSRLAFLEKSIKDHTKSLKKL